MNENLPKIKKLSLQKGSSISSACRKLGLSRMTYYRWLRQSKNNRVGGREKGSVLLEKKLLKLAVSQPNLTIKQLAAKLERSQFFVWKFLHEHNLGTVKARRKKARLAKIYPIKKKKYLDTFGGRVLLLERAKEKGVSFACREFGVSRTLFYKWQKRQLAGEPLENKTWRVVRWGRQVAPEKEEVVLSLVIKYPELSVHKLLNAVPRLMGAPLVGHHGIQNILRRNNLNTYERRLLYSRSQAPMPAVRPAVSLFGRIKSVWQTFVPQVAPAPPPVLRPSGFGTAKPPSFRERLSSLIKPFSLSFFSSSLIFLILFLWLGIFANQPLGTQIGLFFASISLSVGMFFFLYSMKYYFTLALVLSFSTQTGDNTQHTTNNKVNGYGGWLGRIFGLGNSQAGLPLRSSAGAKGGGLQANLDHITLSRHPFISIHLPFYNEKKVANRIISACTSFDYPNYEVIVCDDSSDETVEIVKEWENHPRVKILHRPTREGFKGGALSYALKALDPRTEFVCVFDADFVPYPDTLTQFMKYYKATGGWSENLSYEGSPLQTMPYQTNEKVEIDPSQQKQLETQIESVRAKNNIAVVAGYQWHVLNKSENWITRGVRTEYAGSYVIERPGQEILGAMKIIHGSVYCMRADVLKHFGWGTSITEDYELTLRIYEKGFKVVYTPYIQAPSECVSTIRRLIRQRMRWAEGHSFSTRKMFTKLMFGTRIQTNDQRINANKWAWKPSPLTFTEKLEFLYLTPYYLQAALFLLGTFSWLISETVFRTRLPFWTDLWGWSLVLTNFFALPLMNAVGLFLEESEEKDYLGLLSFLALCYIVTPFQAYAAIKGFLEPEEGTWFRTPKTGNITDIFSRGRFYRWLTGIFPFRPATGGIASSRLAPEPALNPYFALRTANNRFVNFLIPRRKVRWIGRSFLASLLIFSSVILSLAPAVPYFVQSGHPIEKKIVEGKLPRKDFRPDEKPELVFNLSKKDNLQKIIDRLFNLFRVQAYSGELKTSILDNQGRKVDVKLEVLRDKDGKVRVKVPSLAGFKPGAYKLKIESEDEGKIFTQEQDFTWGVLAINPNKSIYLPEETAKLALAVLDEEGNMVCDASLKLKITHSRSSGQEIADELSTENGRIIVNPECQVHDFTLRPDYEAIYQTGGVGIYEMELQAETQNGTYLINDSFEVRQNVPFEVERVTATRIYPPKAYPVTFNIKTNQDFEGSIEETMPASFEIGQENFTTQPEKKIISWEVAWKAGETHVLGYNFDAPDISPQFYLLGPLRFRSGQASQDLIFQEARQWQIAADLLTGDAKVTYTDSTISSPNQIRTRDYIRGNNLWQSEASTSQTSGSTIKFVVDEASPTRNEHLFGIWEQGGSGTRLSILRWNGSSWSTEWTTTTDTTLGLYTRPFDIAYEKSSGDAVVVYSTGAATTNELAYRVWNGSSWVGPTNYNVSGTTALVCGIEIESRPSSDRIAMIYTVNAATNSLNTAVWNGGDWESNPTTALEAGVMEPGAACQSKAYDIAWEESSGEILAAWGQGTTADVWESSACTGGPPCTWGATAQTTAEEGTVLDLATQPGTNNIGISVLSNNGNDFGGGFWNGSSWSSAVGGVDAGAADPDITLGQRSVGVGWLTSGAATRGVLIYADAAAIGVDYTLISSGVVSATETQCGTTPGAVLEKQIKVVQDPTDTSKFMVLVEDANSDLFAVRFTFDGTTVTCADTNGGVAINANLTSVTSQPFDFAFDLSRPPVSPNDLIQFEADHGTIIPTGGITTNGVTTNIYLDSNAGGNTLTESFTPKVEVRDIGTSFSNAVTNTGDAVQFDAEDPDDTRSTCVVYDDLNDRLVMWGGETGSLTKANTNDTWVLSLKEKQRSQWKLLTTSGTRPQANRAHVCVYDSLNDQLIVYGGWNGTTYLTSAWALTLPSSGTPTWSQVAVGASTPPSSGQQLQACAVYDPSPSRMIVYGGYYGTDTDTDVVYQLTLPSPGTGTWSQVIGITAGTPSASGAGRDAASCVYDDDSDRMVMYGGHINANTNEVWSLNLASGSEAWTQISPTGDAGVRAGHEAVFQKDYSGTDDRMIIFAGSDGTNYLNDVWQLTLPESGTSVWTDKSAPVGQRPMARAFGASSSGVYDPLNQRGLFPFGYTVTNYDNVVVTFDLSPTGTFDYRALNDVRYLRGRDAAVMVYDSANSQMVMFGGSSRGIPGSYIYHVTETWKMNASGTPVWRDAGAATGPIVRELGSMVYDPLNNRTVMCFGLTTVDTLADCWKLTIPSSGNMTWSNLSPTGTAPGKRWGTSVVYDDLNDRAVFFGGSDAGGASGTKYQDVNFLSLPSGGGSSAWSVPTTSGPPSVRWGHTAIYDPGRDRMIVFGGTNDTAYYQDVYQLTLPPSGNPTWTALSPTGTKPATRRGHVAVYDPDRGDGTARMVIFGGYDGTNHYNDVWELTLPATGDGAWTQLSPSGNLPWGRRSVSADYDLANDRMIIFGGRNADQFFGDTWAISLSSSPAWTNLDPQVMIPVSVAVTGLTSGTSYHWQSWVTANTGDSSKVSYGGNPETEADFTLSVAGAVAVDQAHYRWRNDSSSAIRGFSFTNPVSSQLLGHVEPDVIKVGNTYYLYYRTDSTLAVASSTDGVTWTDHGTIWEHPRKANLVLNPDVEAGATDPTSWNKSATGATWDTTESRSPTHSLKLSVSAASADWRANCYSVTGGKSHYVSNYTKGTVSANEFYLTIRWFSDTACATFISEDNIAIPIGSYTSWTQFANSVVAPATAQSSDIVFRAINGTGTIYGDDFEVRENYWDSDYAVVPSVYYYNGTYYLFYEGNNNGTAPQIGYATSSSPTGPFTRAASNPVLTKQGSGFESAGVGTPVITRANGKWYLYYHGYNGTNDQGGLAWSTDLTTWTRHPSNPILPLGSSGSWDDYKTAPSSVITIDNTHYVFYEGDGGSNTWKIGVAYVSLSDIETAVLTKHSSNPVLSPNPGSWDDDWVQLPSVISPGDDTLWLYYAGHNLVGDSFSLGRAIDSGTSWKEIQDNQITNQAKNENLRVRFSFKNTGGTASNYQFKLEVGAKVNAACDTDETYTAVPTTTAGCGSAVACITSSSYFTDQDPTTNLLTSEGTWTTGKMVEDASNQTSAITLNQNYYTEAEYNFKFTDQAVDNTTYCFRVTNAGSALTSYSKVATAVVIPERLWLLLGLGLVIPWWLRKRRKYGAKENL